MFSLVKDRVMTTKELLYAEIKSDDSAYDKLFGSCFVTGAVEEIVVDGQKRWGLNLDGAPLVALKEATKSELGLHSETPTVDEMRALGKVDIGRGKMRYGNFSLVSGGAIVYYDGKLLCLKRDAFARADPNCLTTPAGRMSEWLSTMSSLELAEELIIVVKHEKSGKLLTLGGYREGLSQMSESDILVLKQRQIARMLEFMSESGRSEVAAVLDKVGRIDDILLINLNKFASQNMVNERADQVFTFDNYQIKDQCSGFIFFDKKNNTLEFREVFDLTLPGFLLHSILPGEYFQTPTGKVINDTQILGKDEFLGGIEVVPTLRAYLEGLRADKVINFFGKKISNL